MKKAFLVILLSFLAVNASLLAQQSAKPDPKIRELKITMVFKHMELTDSEKSRFLPLYDKYSDENLYFIREIRKVKESNLSDAEKLKQTQKLEEQKLQLKKKYHQEFLKFLTPHQVMQMQKGEDEFRKVLLEELRKK